MAMLDKSDSEKLIHAWFRYYVEKYDDFFFGYTEETIENLFDGLKVKTGEEYYSCPGVGPMKELYTSFMVKYNTQILGTDPSVWIDMDMDRKILQFIQIKQL